MKLKWIFKNGCEGADSVILTGIAIIPSFVLAKDSVALTHVLYLS